MAAACMSPDEELIKPQITIPLPENALDQRQEFSTALRAAIRRKISSGRFFRSKAGNRFRLGVPPHDDLAAGCRPMHEIGTDIASGEPVRLTTDAKRRQLYVIGKSGVGKTNLLRTLMLEDFAAGRGFCFLDPHGDEAERLADSTPPERFDEVIYF